MRMRQEPRITALLLVAALFVLVASILPSKEPHYKGRSLTEWAELWRESSASTHRQEAEQAIREIGTNSLPFVVRDLDYESSGWTKLPPFNLMANARERRCARATTVINILGEQAAPAVPAIGKLLYSPSYLRAAFALASIGPKGLSPLLQALINTNYHDHEVILRALYVMNLKSETSTVLPAIAQYIDSPKTPGLAYALLVLSHLDTDNEDTVALVLHTLQSDRVRQYDAAMVVHNFPKAIPLAIPILRAMSNSPLNSRKDVAIRTLAEISKMTNAPSR